MLDSTVLLAGTSGVLLVISVALEGVASLLLIAELDSIVEEGSALLDDEEVVSMEEEVSSLLDDGDDEVVSIEEEVSSLLDEGDDELDSDVDEATEEGVSELEVVTVELASRDSDVGSVRDTLRRVLELDLEVEVVSSS